MSKRTRLILAILIASAAVVGVILAVTTGSKGSAQLKELAANSEKWQDLNITHYVMKVNIGCFCAFVYRMPVTVEVFKGTVISVVDNTGQNVPADDPIRTIEDSQLLTVEGLFAYAAEAIRTADRTKVSYDPLAGYPVSLSIDRIEQAMDDELAVQITELKPFRRRISACCAAPW
jgi:hypothetical protein